MSPIRRYSAVFTVAALLSVPAWAADPARQLAAESLAFVGRMEALLDGAIRSGDPADFKRFVGQPTLAQMQRWPKIGDAAHDRYRRCFFAVDAFRVYADVSFENGSRADAQSRTAKDYAEQKVLCKQAVK